MHNGAEIADAFVKQAADYVQRHGGRECYSLWPRERVEQYIVFHLRQNTFAWALCREGIGGTIVAWQTNEAYLRKRLERGEMAFVWQPNNLRGDAVFIADAVCTDPGAFGKLVDAMARRFPHWRRLKLFTFRRGKLVEFPPRIVNRIIVKKEAVYV